MTIVISCKLLKGLEAAIGIEPMNKGFADLCLTTWLRRQNEGIKDEGGRMKSFRFSVCSLQAQTRFSGRNTENQKLKTGSSFFRLHNQDLERETRFELATLALARRCSTTELLPLFQRDSILMIRGSLSRQRVSP